MAVAASNPSMGAAGAPVGPLEPLAEDPEARGLHDGHEVLVRAQGHPVGGTPSPLPYTPTREEGAGMMIGRKGSREGGGIQREKY